MAAATKAGNLLGSLHAQLQNECDKSITSKVGGFEASRADLREFEKVKHADVSRQLDLLESIKSTNQH